MDENATEVDPVTYAKYSKITWILYSLAAAIVIIFLVTQVATDNEERLFYGLMGSAVAYVFRPSDKLFKKMVLGLMSRLGKN